jgi:methionyl-tRNA synthetase
VSKKILVTSALPYANGSPHLGHILEFIQTDVYVRARRLAGEDVRFIWAIDAHGTPIDLRARDEGVDPEALVSRMREEHDRLYRSFHIQADIFHTTHSEENRRHVEAIFEALRSKGLVQLRKSNQLFCLHDQMFLPDRYVKGTCPKCAATGQYGDSCEACGATYTPTELLSPHCALCGSMPEERASEHLYVTLSKVSGLREWVFGADIPSSVRNYLERWMDAPEGLRDWCISRDAPYFGFPIPGHDGKFFYVWFDAPIGYIGAAQRWCDLRGESLSNYWRSENSEIIHVIGKDITYFHCLFWPALLLSGGYRTPSKIQVHGWLMINGQKMSKSRGTFVRAQDYLDHLPPEYLRYYFASKLGSEPKDLDLDLADFSARINAELVGKLTNLVSRCHKLVVSKLESRLSSLPPDFELLGVAQQLVEEARERYLAFDSSGALKVAVGLVDRVNQYINTQAPWKLVDSDPEKAREVCTAGLWVCKILSVLLNPVVPVWSEKVDRALGVLPSTFSTACEPFLPGHLLGEFEPPAQRVSLQEAERILGEV